MQTFSQHESSESFIKYKDLKDISLRELVTIVPLAIIILLFGVYPAPLLNMISPAMEGIIEIVKSAI